MPRQRYFVVAAALAMALVACHKPHAATPQAAVHLYAQAIADNNPRLAYSLLSQATRARTPYREFAARWQDQRAERMAQLAAVSQDLTPAASPMVFERIATVATEPAGSRRGTHLNQRGAPDTAARYATFVKHGDYWYVDTPLLSATYYDTPEAAVTALSDVLGTPAMQTLIGVWTTDRRIELAQQLDIASKGLGQALAAGTRANRLGEDRAQFSFYGGDLWFLITLMRQDGQWHIENIYSDTGVYPIP